MDFVDSVHEEKYLRTKDVCKFLNISRNTFYSLVKQGVIPAIDLKKGTGKRPTLRVSLTDLQKYISSLSSDKNSIE